MKTCAKCKKSKPNNNEYFAKNKACKDDLNTVCKQCLNEYTKEYRRSNSDKIKEYQREYYQANKDILLKKNAKWAIENREQMRFYRKKWNVKNKDKMRFYLKKWRVKNREKVHQSAGIRRLNMSKGAYSLEDWEQTKAYFDNRCAYCGVSSDVLSQDHFIPLSKNGSYTKDNIVPACISCNCSKSNTDFEEWFTKQEFYNFDRLQKIENYLKEIEHNGKTYKS